MTSDIGAIDQSGGPKAGNVLPDIIAFLGRSPAFPLLIALIIVFSLGSPRFLTLFNISSVLNQAVLIGILGVGLTPLVISGNIDLSVGATAAFGACLLVFLESYVGLWPSVGVTLVACLAIGLLNGLVVERLGLNAIIVTLAAGRGLRGLTFLVFGTQTVMAPDTRLLDIAEFKLFGFDMSVVAFLALGLLFALMLRFTVHGVNTFAVGGNRRAALDAGVNITLHVLANFALSGLMAGLVGVIMVAQQRAQAAQDVVAKHPGVKILDVQVGNWSQGQGQSIMENFITRFGKKIDGVLSSDGYSGTVAYLAVQAAAAAGQLDPRIEDHALRDMAVLIDRRHGNLTTRAPRSGFGALGVVAPEEPVERLRDSRICRYFLA